ncbi:MAG: penicillin-binding protein A [Oscillospiraceae bacterium]|nr:penicillin-binding protein A [Oscillospiraceae bacterium]
MDKKQLNRRLLALGAAFAVCLVCYLVVMFDAQIVHGEEYLARSVRSNTTVEAVRTSRGIITDRNGKVMVSNRSVYTLELVPSLAPEEDEALNGELSRLIALMEQQEIVWEDILPLTVQTPVSYTDSEAQKAELLAYLVDEDLLSEGETLPDAVRLLALLRSHFAVGESLSAAEARKLVGLRYTLAITERDREPSFPLASDIDVTAISLVKDGDYRPVRVGTSSMRRYHTAAAAHILGRINLIYKEDWPTYKEKGYAMDALVGIEGVELVFEDYLRGKDGKRIVTRNTEGKITGELYSVEPEPGASVALTIDLDLQEAVEASLQKAVSEMTAADSIKRRASAAVVEVNSGEVLALASNPTYSLETFQEDYKENYENPLQPFNNYAVTGLYAPGSTFKPLTAIAALESGIITPKTTVNATGVYYYYDLALKCWLYGRNGGSHGYVDVTEAINVSCNYFFYDVGRLTGIATLARYAKAFGLGEPTGIELPESVGHMTTPDYVNSIKGHRWTDGQTLTASIGQSYSSFTPLQLANYIATLANGGTRYNAHLLKTAKTYDGSKLLAVYDEPPAETIPLQQENLDAVLEGMHRLTTTGSVAWYFQNCVVETGAKTGTAQTGGNAKENGVFVCFAPYDEPEIAIAVVIEKAGSGVALATTVVDIVNSYFTSADALKDVHGENELIP